MFRQLNPFFRTFVINKRRFHTNNCLFDFYEKPRGGYPLIYDEPPVTQNLSFLEKLKLGYHEFKKECKLFGKEVRDKLHLHPTLVIPNEEEIVLKFDGTVESLKKWVVTCDSDYKEGFSTAKLELSPFGTGVFHGTLNTTVPKDGKTKRAGFCNITTIPKRKSFKRKDYYNWHRYSHLTLRVRGDGRCYMVNLLQKGYFDITWFHTYSYLMYTRGGPYWQDIKIPFSKFVFQEKGTIQDRQYEMPDSFITNIGITLADKKPGPFRLEIDHIGVYWNPLNFESCAYELNDMSKPTE